MGVTAARAFADRYVEIINNGEYSELRDLFAEDAVFLAPHGQEFRGRAEIGAFYEKFLGEITPTIRIASYVEQGNDCVYELEAIAASVAGRSVERAERCVEVARKVVGSVR